MYPNPQCCWLWLTNWKISRAVPPEPKVSELESQDGHGTKDKTPKKVKPVDTGDNPRKHHKSCEEKSQLRHSLTEKSSAL